MHRGSQDAWNIWKQAKEAETGQDQLGNQVGHFVVGSACCRHSERHVNLL